MKKGDLVTRYKYNHDIVFKIIDIKNNIAILKGECVRLSADAPIIDLKITVSGCDKEIIFKNIINCYNDIMNMIDLFIYRYTHLYADTKKKVFLNIHKSYDIYRKFDNDGICAIFFKLSETQQNVSIHKNKICLLVGDI